jgi:undecaprenyl-diphosphatase
VNSSANHLSKLCARIKVRRRTAEIGSRHDNLSPAAKLQAGLALHAHVKHKEGRQPQNRSSPLGIHDGFMMRKTTGQKLENRCSKSKENERLLFALSILFCMLDTTRMRRLFPTTFLLCIVLCACTRAQTAESIELPLRSDKTLDKLPIIGSLALTVLLIQTDQQTYDVMYAWKKHNSTIGTLSPMVTEIGSGAFSIGLFTGFLGYSVITDDRKAMEVGKIGLESFLLSGVTVQFLKHMFGRQRPSVSTVDGGVWHGPLSFFSRGHGQGQSHYDAFPSGHTATVFAAATTIADFYEEPWVSYVSYSLASTVAISRVTESTHWVSDCFLGALIGYASTKLVEHWNYSTHDVSLQPLALQTGYGVQLQMKF